MDLDMPAHWETAKLAELAVLTLGGDWGKEAEFESAEYSLAYCIRGVEFRNWDADRGSTASPRMIKNSSLLSRKVQEGDILVEISGGGPEQPVGRTVLIDKTVLGRAPHIPKICTNFLRLLRPTQEIASSYLNCYLTFFYRSGEIRNYQAGSNNLRNLKFNDYLSLEIPLPPLAEQHRIVAKIEELFSELDQGVASLKTAREQLKVYRQSLLKNAFEGKLTATTGWREKSLGQLLGFLTSGSRGWAAYYATSGDLFVRAQNIKHDRLELDDVAFVALPDKAEGLRTRIQRGDLLITITGANVTKSALVKHDLGAAYVSQHVALCRPTTEILPEYLYWFIVAEAAGRKQLTDMAYGAGKPGLNLENIRSVSVPFPNLHEQQEIVEQIESKLSEADQLDQTLATALQQADALRQSILKKAFHGQLVKQDKNEEPATALLERIRAARATAPAKGRQAKMVSKSLTNC
jgi:type I restriction enzyme S subunit